MRKRFVIANLYPYLPGVFRRCRKETFLQHRVAGTEQRQLPPLLHARTHVTTRTEETRLWDQPAALLLFFALLTVEWVARKRVGLP